LFTLLSSMISLFIIITVFFFHAPATPEIYTLSLHDALPICTPPGHPQRAVQVVGRVADAVPPEVVAAIDDGRAVRQLLDPAAERDRKSTRLNSSHVAISYAVFCLKKKKKKI